MARECLAIKLRAGNAGANQAGDHLDVLGEAFAQVPAVHHRHVLVRADSAGASRKVLDWYQRTATTMTSGGNQKPAKADFGGGQGPGRADSFTGQACHDLADD